MDFGKLHDISQVDFHLPPDPPTNATVLANRNSKVEQPKTLYIGATGWSVKEWVGKVYQKGTKPPDFLRQYGSQFNTIELNTTHYRIPDHFTVQHWHDEVPTDFKFCPKVLQTISHSSDLGVKGDLIGRFCESMGGLANRLGPCFVQMPPYFGPDRLGVLEVFLRQFSLPLAVEVRNASWFDNELNFNNLCSLLEQYGAFTVITDVAGRRDVAHMRLTSNVVLVRFVGNNLHPTDFSRLDDWAARLEQWFSMGLESCFFFTHEPDNLLAPDLAAAFWEKTKHLGGVQVRGPRLASEPADGLQMTLF